MALDGFLAAASPDLFGALAQLGDEWSIRSRRRANDSDSRSTCDVSSATESAYPCDRTLRSGLVPSGTSQKVKVMRVRISDPSLAEELLGFLRRADCIADVGDVEAHAEGIAVVVEVPQAYDDHQARMEVSLYLRVWEATHPGSGVELLESS